MLLDLAELWIRLAVALGIGLLIGAERERRKGDLAAAERPGVRSFALAAILGAISFHLGGIILLALMAALETMLTTFALRRPRVAKAGPTSDLSLLLTCLLGALAMREPVLASGVGVTVAALLMARARLHHLVNNVITSSELHDVLILAGAALVVMPIMPDRFMGPFDAINPQALWRIVVLMLAISAAGHVAVRALGVRYGLPLTGLLSGFVSSAMAISVMGHHFRRQPIHLSGAVAGAMFSTMVTAGQMAILLATVSPPTLAALSTPLACAAGMACVYALVSMVHQKESARSGQDEVESSFGLSGALLLAATIGAVLMVSAAIYDLAGSAGLVITSAVSGFADAHAPGIAVGTLVAGGKLEPAAAIVPVMAAMSTNTFTKIILAWTGGGRTFAWRVAPGLLLTLGAAWLGVVVSSADTIR